MSADEWKAFLANWTRETAARDNTNPNTARAIDPVYGFGYAGANDEQLAGAIALSTRARDLASDLGVGVESRFVRLLTFLIRHAAR
jgi:hypothetical protein